MRVLLDTHALIWWLAGDSQLSAVAQDVIGRADTEVLVSAASAWEVATKYRIGKLPNARELALDFRGCISRQGFLPLDVRVEDGQRAGLLAGEHRDPFDRMLIAQALALDVPIVSNERLFEGYGVKQVW